MDVFFYRVRRGCWKLTFAGSIVGAMIVFAAMEKGGSHSTGQYALGIAFAVIPFCMAYAASELAKK